MHQITFFRYLLTVFIVVIIFANHTFARDLLNVSSSSIYTSKNDAVALKKVVQVLQEEVQKRSGISFQKMKKVARDGQAQIIIALDQEVKSLPDAHRNILQQMEGISAEGYQIAVLPEAMKIIVYAKDKRGALYGVGKLLRSMEIRENEVLVPSELILSSTPRYEIRGHQLGYRPKTNSYDAWSVAQFDQYIRELAIFGANSIEIMPPRTDDDFTSVHMQIPAIDMIRAQSRICDDYDLDVWMWYPNMGEDYLHPDSIKNEIKERHEVFSAVPRLDHLFVPGGDPGDVEPEVLFDWLTQVADVLHQYHPDAKIWISPQVFRPTASWFDQFFNLINRKYDWLGGVVFGPWVKMQLEDIRKIVDPDIPIRRYPDITHSLSSQYPIPKWDLAYAITLGRECINPRPNDQKMIHNVLARFANGSLSYSEGTNDDVNKFIWSDQDWNPETPAVETLREYARFFIDPDLTEEIAQGMLALERNMEGSLLTNEQVQNTLMQWQEIENRASPTAKANYRFQMGLIRAYYDAYVQKRLVYETWLEQQALSLLGNYQISGIANAINDCKSTLAQAWEAPIEQILKQRCYLLADELFASIGAQLTVEKHNAMSGRGNFIDNIDNPLNDVAWIFSELSKAEKKLSDDERIKMIQGILTRTNPGAGGFYDNFGNPASWERIILRQDPATDPGGLKTPRVGFGVGLKDTEWVHEVNAQGFEGDASPMAWMNQVTALYDQPLEVEYKNLDPHASYTIRVAYTGRFRSNMKMIADGIQIHDFIRTGIQPVYEFPIPQEALKDGRVTFTWTCGEAERGAQVSEIWIIKDDK